MIIIAGHELVDAQQRDEHVAAHRDLVSRARAFDGCIHVAITADSVDPERINSVEVEDLSPKPATFDSPAPRRPSTCVGSWVPAADGFPHHHINRREDTMTWSRIEPATTRSGDKNTRAMSKPRVRLATPGFFVVSAVKTALCARGNQAGRTRESQKAEGFLAWHCPHIDTQETS